MQQYLESDELNEMPLADIIEICRERNLPTEGTKSQLISDLLFWVSQYTNMHKIHNGVI